MPKPPQFPHIDAALEPYRKLREQSELLAKMHSPLNSANSRLMQFVEAAALGGATSVLARQIEALQRNPLYDTLQRQMNALNEMRLQSRNVAEEIFKATNTASVLNARIRDLIKPHALEQSLHLLKKLGLGAPRSLPHTFGVSEPLGGRLDQIFGAVGQPTIESQMTKMLRRVSVAPLASVAVAEGALRLNNTIVPFNELESTISMAADAAESAAPPKQLATFLNVILADALQLTDARALALIIFVLMWLANAVTEGAVQTITGELLRPVTDAVIRRLKPTPPQLSKADSQVDEYFSNRYRIVAALNLQVRSAPQRKDSHIISRVSTPTPVLLIRKKQDWSLIRYRDGEALVQGWVFSRYLRRLP